MKKKILVIDDEQPTLDMFGLYLDALGYKAQTAKTGEQGLELFRKNPTSLVLTDIKMPGMDGLEVLKQIKTVRPSTEVIVITGHGDSELALQALNLDAADFVNKPICREALESALRRAEERLKTTQTESMGFSTSINKNVVNLEINTGLNSLSESSLVEALTTAQKKNLKLNIIFGPYASLSGAGIAVLSELLEQCEQKKVVYALTGLPKNFQEILLEMGTVSQDILFATEQEACEVMMKE